MSITITLGKSGRLVVPKAIRSSLGLQEGSRLRLEVQGGKIEASPESDEVPIIMENGFPVFTGGRKLGAQQVVDIIKTDRDSGFLQDKRLGF
jgi:AbrB family looped-hinge helix DNA binding protein